MKFRIILKAFDHNLITLASEQLRSTLLKTEAQLKGVISLPTKIKRFCVLRSPHIDKDSREHFELRLYKRFIDVEATSPSVLDALLKTDLPSGINCSLKILQVV
jgi:small subunit ribosomal protein S10